MIARYRMRLYVTLMNTSWAGLLLSLDQWNHSTRGIRFVKSVSSIDDHIGHNRKIPQWHYQSLRFTEAWRNR